MCRPMVAAVLAALATLLAPARSGAAEWRLGFGFGYGETSGVDAVFPGAFELSGVLNYRVGPPFIELGGGLGLIRCGGRVFPCPRERGSSEPGYLNALFGLATSKRLGKTKWFAGASGGGIYQKYFVTDDVESWDSRKGWGFYGKVTLRHRYHFGFTARLSHVKTSGETYGVLPSKTGDTGYLFSVMLFN